jgi:hypothetical protein
MFRVHFHILLAHEIVSRKTNLFYKRQNSMLK